MDSVNLVPMSDASVFSFPLFSFIAFVFVIFCNDMVVRFSR